MMEQSGILLVSKKIIFLLIIAFGFVSLNAKVITDMMGNEVNVKDNIQKAFSASPPMTAVLYTLAPEYMIGLNYNILEVEKRYMLKEVQNLPVLGGLFGGERQTSLEKLIALKPDVVFACDTRLKPNSDFEKSLQKANIPIFMIKQNSFEDNILAINLMGEVLNKQERALKLTNYAKENLERVKKSVETLDKNNKIRVYFAQKFDGLTTMCEGDMQSQIITLAGGVNVHKCDTISKSPTLGKITLEQLYIYDPDIIFVREKSTYMEIMKETSAWRNLSAYKNNKIFLVPSSPFSWLTNPPTFMRFFGLPWLHSKMYPEHFRFNENDEVKKFYELFLHIKLDDSDVKKVLQVE